MSRFSLPRLDRHTAQAESLKNQEKVWKSAIKCDGSAHMSHLKARPYRSMVDPRVENRGAERLYCNTFPNNSI